jgi:hypothetical protein
MPERRRLRNSEDTTTGKPTLWWDITQSRMPVVRPDRTVFGILEIWPSVAGGKFRYRGDEFPRQEMYYVVGTRREQLMHTGQSTDVAGMARLGAAKTGLPRAGHLTHRPDRHHRMVGRQGPDRVDASNSCHALASIHADSRSSAWSSERITGSEAAQPYSSWRRKASHETATIPKTRATDAIVGLMTSTPAWPSARPRAGAPRPVGR